MPDWKSYFLHEMVSDGRRVVNTDLPPVDSPLEPIRIFVSEDSFSKLAQSSRSRQSGEDDVEVEAFLQSPTTGLLPCELSPRGYSSWHHRPEKLSLRVRFSKRERSPGYRWWELQRPEDVLAQANWLPEQLGEHLDLVTGKSTPVRVNLNGADQGVYLRTLRPGERLALENGRLPGLFFKGDQLLKDSVWETSDDWNIEGDSTPEQLEFFRAFLGQVAGGATPEALEPYLNWKAYTRMLALADFTGTRHFDDRHNQMFYLNSYQGKLEPVVWDFNSLGLMLPLDIEINVPFNRIVALLFRDPRLVLERDQALYDLLQNGRILERFEAQYEKLRADLLSDRGLINLVSGGGPHGITLVEEFDASQVPDHFSSQKKLIQGRLDYLSSYLRDARYSVAAEAGNLRISVFGNVAVLAKRKSGEAFFLYPGMQPGEKRLEPAPLEYTLPGLQAEWEFLNAVTGETANLTQAPAPSSRLISSNPGPVAVESELREVSIGPGTVEVTQDVVLKESDKLVVKAGTRLRFHKGVSLVSKGVVSFEGTAEKPIVVEPVGQAFGVVGLVGPGTGGSVFRHVKMEGGTTTYWGGVDFKGMFNVYGCPDLLLENCEFASNSVGDDAVNLALSKVEVRDSVFRDVPSDALDLDGCIAVVENCRFLRSGNDGLDVMETTMTVKGCTFQGCGDKGLSVGEESEIEVTDCAFVECVTGLEVKDDSTNRIGDSTFTKCITAVNAYRKKWLFMKGGYAQLTGVKATDCDSGVKADTFSKVWLENSEIEVDQSSLPRVFTQGRLSLRAPSVRL